MLQRHVVQRHFQVVPRLTELLCQTIYAPYQHQAMLSEAQIVAINVSFLFAGILHI